jgi:hypothetical protein
MASYHSQVVFGTGHVCVVFDRTFVGIAIPFSDLKVDCSLLLHVRSSMTLHSALTRELQSGARTLRRNPGFTITALATLSLGIGTVSALFSVVDRVLLQPLPYADPDRLVQLITMSQVGEQSLTSIPKFLFWRDTTTSFTSMAASDVEVPEVNLTQSPYRGALKTARVSADYFEVLGAPLAIGRTFSAREDSPGGPKAVVISDALWRRCFRSESSSNGRETILDNVPYLLGTALGWLPK